MRRAILRQWLDRLQTSYWFVPGIASILAVLLARILIWVDIQIPNYLLVNSSIIYTGGIAETRAALLGMAGSVLGTAGIVFSLLTLPMSVAAAQFGSRLLRVYLRDRTTQFVLGAFAGTFVYCITVALSIPASSNAEAPQIAMTVGLVLTLGTFFSLIALIHHMGTSLEAPNVIAAASQELRDVLNETVTLDTDDTKGDFHAPLEWWDAHIKLEGLPIYATALGYIQAIDPEIIRPLASKHNLIIRLVSKPGTFVQKGELLAMVYPHQHVMPHVAETIRDCYVLGNLRTPSQDVQYAFNQLVEVALRAMSPAINDPYTAITCLDHLGAGLAIYVDKSHEMRLNPEAMRGQRIIFNPLSLAEVLDATFSMLRRASREMPDVLLAMVEALAVTAQQCTQADERAEVVRHIQLVEMESNASAAIAADKQRVSARCRQLSATYSEPAASFMNSSSISISPASLIELPSGDSR
jgi:uncharacterized membrane protein